MTFPLEALDPLDAAVPASALFRDWVRGSLDADMIAPEHRSAAVELASALQDSAGPADRPAPLFASSWVEGWAEDIAEDYPGEADRTRFLAQVAALRAGAADVVVTGQQPGFLGGPLYTLYKVATAIALADRRSAAGRPTVPVFWSGDDDDDLDEAFEPVAWLPEESRLRGGVRAAQGAGGRSRPPVLGRMVSGSWKEQAAALLAGYAAGRPLSPDAMAGDLADIWKQAQSRNWTWARLARRAVLRIFAGRGLVVVSGDDPGLQAAGGPLYERILASVEGLARLARERGDLLADRGWHAQISPRSIARPLFRMAGDHREPWMPGDHVPDPALLRPGVMLRSPLQDWLLQPAAVVVGPGELAYLRQLDPLYGELDIPRPPLVPRLFAWLAPGGFSRGKVEEFRQHPAAESDLAEDLAGGAEAGVRRILEDILQQKLGLDPERARSLSAGRTRRWSKGVVAMLRGEIERIRHEAAAEGPEWVFPEGKRQERKLATCCAAALWGHELVTTCLEAASDHLEEGRQGNWREYLIRVPDPAAREE